MNTINQTGTFRNWLRRLNDARARQRILRRMTMAAEGNFGDHHGLSDGVSEMRVDYGPGYRIYYAQEGKAVYLLLVGGDKRSQRRDIANAISMWNDLKG